MLRKLIIIPCLLHGFAWAQPRSCEDHLESVITRLREIEVDYQALRVEHPVIYAQSAPNTRINGFLGEGLTKILEYLDATLSRVPRARIDELTRDLDRDYPHSTALPYVNPVLKTYTDEFEKVVRLMNSKTINDDDLVTVVGGGTLVVPRETYQFYREFLAGRGRDPFYLAPDSWMIVLARNPALFRRAFVAHQKFLARRPAVDRAFELLTAAWDAQDPRVQSTYELLTGVLARNQDLIKGWRQLPTFDMSSVSEERRVIDGSFFASAMPVGAYGLRLNRHLRRVTQVVTLLLETEAAADLDRFQDLMPTLIGRETARGRGSKKYQRHSSNLETDPLLRIVVEGTFSISQSLNFLLTDEVPGARERRELLRDLLRPKTGAENSTVVELTAALRMGLLGPSTISGTRFDQLLRRDDSDRLVLAPELTAHLRSRIDRGPQNPMYENHRNRLPCPVASTTACGQRKTGLQFAADLYLKISEQIEY